MILKSINEVSEKALNSFFCGNSELDRFLSKYALRNDQNGYGKTFVLEDNKKLIGFFTLCSSSIKFEEFPTTNGHLLPRYPIPCIRIARLAVEERFQRKGYGKELLKQAFLKIIDVSTTVGVRLIVVDAKETSKKFYEKYGFTHLKVDKLSYYILLDTVIEAFKETHQ